MEKKDPPDDSDVRPHGPDEVCEALVSAGADLFATQGDVSVRTIARKAGVNHGLIHHYFGGKEGLRRAVLDQLAFEISSDLDGSDGSLPSLMAQTIHRLRSDDRFVRVLARGLLNNEVPEPFQSVFPVVQRMKRAAQAEGIEDPELFVGESIALALGTIIFGPWIQQALGLSEEEAEAVFSRGLLRRVQELQRLKGATG